MSATSTVEVPKSSTWKMDPVHSNAQFKVRHMMISNVKGEFTSLSGTLVLDNEDITKSRIEASIDAASINTREPQRDAHLKSADFFDVAKFPTLAFKSTRVARKGEGWLEVTGDLTIHGVTRSETLEVEGPTAAIKDPYGKTRIGLSATAKIDRKDFGLAWNGALEAGGLLIGDEVAITIDVEFVKE